MSDNGQKARATASEKRRGFGAINIHKTLRSEILSLVLKPNQLLDEVCLAQRFQVSRSPLREALIKLEAEGLVSTLPNKGSVVVGLDIEGIPRYIDALDLVQRSLTRLAAENRTQDDLHEINNKARILREAEGCDDCLSLIESSMEFRLAIAHASGNRYLIDAYARLLVDGQRMLSRCYQLFGSKFPTEILSCLDNLVEAIKTRNAALAEEMGRQDAENFHGLVLSLLSQRRTREFTAGVNALPSA
ncbi:GntR family transcriptional regulator (plasmid) [Agrobacterium leguminum]|uniref:GntR family transcriptional regulator n=1 Tax=Agrobacterium leguminum TaxID=2792015 RepID=UPI0030D54E48